MTSKYNLHNIVVRYAVVRCNKTISKYQIIFIGMVDGTLHEMLTSPE